LTPELSATPEALPTRSFSTKVISSKNIEQLKLLDGSEFIGKTKDFFSRSLRFTHNSRTVAANNLSEIHVWDVFTDQPVVTFEQSSYIWEIAISSNGTMVASFDDNGTLKLWNMQTGKEMYTLARNTVWNTIGRLAFSPNNTILASGDFDGRVTFWDIHTGKELTYLMDPNGYITSIAFSPDENIIAIGTQYKITLWDMVSKQLIRTIDFGTKQDEFEGIHRVFFSQSGEMIAATDLENIAMVWDVSTGKKLDTIVGENDFVLTKSEGALAFSPDDTIIATGNDFAGTVILWDVLAHRKLRTIDSKKCIPIELNFLRDGNILEIGCNNGIIQFWGIP
jgi:WD40 repeat protein